MQGANGKNSAKRMAISVESIALEMEGLRTMLPTAEISVIYLPLATRHR
jgi:hypothetical protein